MLAATMLLQSFQISLAMPHTDTPAPVCRFSQALATFFAIQPLLPEPPSPSECDPVGSVRATPPASERNGEVLLESAAVPSCSRGEVAGGEVEEMEPPPLHASVTEQGEKGKGKKRAITAVVAGIGGGQQTSGPGKEQGWIIKHVSCRG